LDLSHAVNMFPQARGRTFVTAKHKSTRKAENMILIKTSKGDIKIKLYNETPLHRDNFIKNVESGVLNGSLFHRVIKGFMIQGGDPDSIGAAQGKSLGGGGLKNEQGMEVRIPAEIDPTLFHTKGALAAARTMNAAKESSNCQFYIVHGNPVISNQLESFERRKGMVYPEEVKATYMREGGTPSLDGEYTVFGQVVEGMDVIDAIAQVEVDRSDRPKEDISMRLEML